MSRRIIASAAHFQFRRELGQLCAKAAQLCIREFYLVLVSFFVHGAAIFSRALHQASRFTEAGVQFRLAPKLFELISRV
jgi:hypothetical protein